MASVYGIDFGVGDVTDLLSMWRVIKGEDFETDGLRELVPGIPAELEDQSKDFPRLAARAVCKKGAFVKFVYDDLVTALAQRFNGYGQVSAAYPKFADLLNYMGIIEAMNEKHAALVAERKQSNMTWNEMCDRRDGVGKTVWERFGVADQSTVYAQ